MPRLPPPAQLSDLCREAAATESVQPDLVEKDLYLTRVLWALGEQFGAGLLLKGGTLLSKVDLGFFRMSEDADLIMPGTPARTKGANMRRINEVRDALTRLEPTIGAKRKFPGGEDHDRGAHRVWELHYPSDFGPQAIRLEVSIHPVLRPPRQVHLRQLLSDPLAGDYGAARCWALDPDEARAEKVRAAFTREAIRDFYDLDRLADAGADLSSAKFLQLVDLKLAELGALPMGEQHQPFGLTPPRTRKLKASEAAELLPVLRTNAPTFDLPRVLDRFQSLWRKP